MKTRHILIAALLAALTVEVVKVGVAYAHSGSPAFVTWSDGDDLNATDLNNALAHMHNTFSAGIVDANISASAAIAHSKLATPALVPKAWAEVYANCDGTSSAGTACSFVGSRVTTVAADASSGVYCVQLAYTPTDGHFAVNVTSHTATSVCMATSQSTGASCGSATTHMLVKCFDYTGAAANNNQFSLTVLDDN